MRECSFISRYVIKLRLNFFDNRGNYYCVGLCLWGFFFVFVYVLVEVSLSRVWFLNEGRGLNSCSLLDRIY